MCLFASMFTRGGWTSGSILIHISYDIINMARFNTRHLHSAFDLFSSNQFNNIVWFKIGVYGAIIYLDHYLVDMTFWSSLPYQSMLPFLIESTSMRPTRREIVCRESRERSQKMCNLDSALIIRCKLINWAIIAIVHFNSQGGLYTEVQLSERECACIFVLLFLWCEDIVLS